VGRIGTLLSFLRSDKNGTKVSQSKIDTGGGANITVDHYAPLGDDSSPLENDFVFTSEIPQSGGMVAVAYLDPKNDSKAEKGEKRIYARKADGSVSAEIWLKSDGTIIVTNDGGDNTFNPDGSVDFANGAKLDASGDYLSSTNISLSNHTHVGNMGSLTGPPLP